MRCREQNNQGGREPGRIQNNEAMGRMCTRTAGSELCSASVTDRHGGECAHAQPAQNCAQPQ